MEEKKLENIEEVTEEVAEDMEEIETKEESEDIPENEAEKEDTYASISQELDIPTYKDSKKKNIGINKSLISLVLAVIFALGAVAYSGFGIYDAHTECKNVYAENTYDEVFKQEYVEIMDGYVADMRIAYILQGQNFPRSYEEMLEMQGKTLDQDYEEKYDEIMSEFKETYDKGHAEWKVKAEKEIFAPARAAMVKEIIEKVVVGLIMLAVAYLLYISYTILRKNQY